MDKPRLIIFTGAGLSAESGIPTFRDANGLWHNHDIDQVANGRTWRNNWNIVRQFYNERRTNLATVEPNIAHTMIAKWQAKYNTIVMTQNIDDLLERAGCTNVIHLHGRLTEMFCVACGVGWDQGYDEWSEQHRCINCNSQKGVRPNVVFFHEHAPEYAKMYKAFRNLTSKDCVIIIGTSGQVINTDALLTSARCLRVLNNLDPNPFMDESCYDHILYGKATEMISKIDSIIEMHMEKFDGRG